MIAGEVFNVSEQNYTVSSIAEIVKSVVNQEFPEGKPIEIGIVPTDDKRSYRVTSKKVEEKLGFKPTRNVEDAIRDLCRAFKQGKLPNSLEDERYFNIKRMKTILENAPN